MQTLELVSRRHGNTQKGRKNKDKDVERCENKLREKKGVGLPVLENSKYKLKHSQVVTK